jgi:hypothetical protein
MGPAWIRIGNDVKIFNFPGDANFREKYLETARQRRGIF